MNKTLLSEALTCIDENIIDDYFEIKAKMKKPKKRIALWSRIGAVAACFALLAVAALWLFLPASVTEEQVMYCISIPISGFDAEYQVITKMSRYEKMVLGSRVGEPFAEHGELELFKLKGRDSIEFLIVRNSEGEYRLLKFIRYWSEDGAVDVTFGQVLNEIYGIASADEFNSVRFSKSNHFRDDIGEKVFVNTTVIDDAESLGRIYSILSGLKFYEHKSIVSSVSPHDEAYLRGEKPLSAQTERLVKLKLTDGRELELYLYASDGCISIPGGIIYAEMADADRDWLIGRVGIDTQYRDWGIPDDMGDRFDKNSNATEVPGAGMANDFNTFGAEFDTQNLFG